MPVGAMKAQSLNIFLIRDGVPPEGFLKPGSVPITLRGVGDLYVKQNSRKPPRWLAFFQDRLSGTPDLYNASNGALLVIKRRGRTFVLSFGQGRHLLQTGTFEENFGLRVTLNSVDPARLKSVDRKSFDAISCHTRTQASQEGDVTAFGLNVEQDLLRAATGYPRDPNLGIRMTGMDSLLVAVPTDLDALPVLLDECLTKFRDESYKKEFPWVDHLAEVRDPRKREELDNLLVETIQNTNLPDMPAWLAVPELIEWANVGGFRYRDRSNAEMFPDLHIRDFLSTLRDPGTLKIATLKQRQVIAYNVSDDLPIRKWTVYSCLYAELEKDETTYLLSSGKWYRVERDFVAAVNRDVKKLAEPSTLPRYVDNSEGTYNERVASASGGKIALVDKKLVRIGGTAVEFCDLFTGKELIHVKKYGGSSVLSHLFAQGSVSANSFLEDADFRAAVNTKLPPSHRVKDPAQRPDPRGYKVLYAVISRSRKPIGNVLPFFSRLNLRNAARQLQAYGFGVAVTKIDA